MKPAICIPCNIVPFSREGEEVERGDPRGVNWGYPDRHLPKHAGGCSEHWPGMGKTAPGLNVPRAAEEVLADQQAEERRVVNQWFRDQFAVMRPAPPSSVADCAPQNTHAEPPARLQVQRKPVPGTSGGVKAPKRRKGRK